MPNLRDDIKAIVNLPAGRNLLGWIIFDLCKIHESKFHTNALVNARLTGRQDIGLELLNVLRQVEPEALTNIFAERILRVEEHSESDWVSKLEEELKHG